MLGSASWGARPHVLTSSPLEEPPPVGTSPLGLRLRRALPGETRTFSLHPSPSRDAVPSRWRWPPPEAVPPATPCPLMDGCALPVCGASLAQPTLRGPRARRLRRDIGVRPASWGQGRQAPEHSLAPAGGSSESSGRRPRCPGVAGALGLSQCSPRALFEANTVSPPSVPVTQCACPSFSETLHVRSFLRPVPVEGGGGHAPGLLGR